MVNLSLLNWLQRSHVVINMYYTELRQAYVPMDTIQAGLALEDYLQAENR